LHRASPVTRKEAPAFPPVFCCIVYTCVCRRLRTSRTLLSPLCHPPPPEHAWAGRDPRSLLFINRSGAHPTQGYLLTPPGRFQSETILKNRRKRLATPPPALCASLPYEPRTIFVNSPEADSFASSRHPIPVMPEYQDPRRSSSRVQQRRNL